MKISISEWRFLGCKAPFSLAEYFLAKDVQLLMLEKKSRERPPRRGRKGEEKKEGRRVGAARS